jgi:hypothetical protein
VAEFHVGCGNLFVIMNDDEFANYFDGIGYERLVLYVLRSRNSASLRQAGRQTLLFR